MTAPRAILFDLDGTLVDSNDFHADTWEQVFRESGHPVPRDAIRGQIGKGGDLLVPTLLPGLDQGVQKQLAHRHGILFKQLFLGRVQPFPSATALVQRVHAASMKVVLASSASAEELDHYGRLLHIEHLVDERTTIDDVATSKPAPDIVAKAAEKAGVDPSEALVIGDTPFDIEGATAAGIRTIAVYDDVADLLGDFDTSPLAA